MAPRSNLQLTLARVALVWTLATAPLAGAVDPHYDGLLRQGSYALERGDGATAAKLLRLACFGLLDEPPLLADCLVRLGLAQARTEDTAGFIDTFRRLSEVESRDRVYSAGRVSAELKDRFEDASARLVPRSTLAESPAFRHLATRSEELDVRRLPTSRRRDEILRRIAAEPTNGRWKLLAAETAIEEGRWPEAVDWASKALAEVKTPRESSDGHCLRGFALSRQERCGEAVADLAACTDSRTLVEPARALLGCWVDLGRFSEAAELVAALPAALREDRHIEALRRRIPAAEPAASIPASPRPVNEPPSPPVPVPPPAPAVTPAPAPEARAPGSATLTAAESGKLEQARKLLAEARRRADLDEPFRLAQEVADLRPGHRESQFLAASIAYRSSRWEEAVRYFRQGGEPETAELQFYFAVALYETGDRAAAAEVLRRSLPGLERTPFVEGYREKILTDPARPGGNRP